MIISRIKLVLFVLIGFTIWIISCKQGEEKTEQTTMKEKPSVTRVSEVTLHGMIVAVDHENKTFTLKDEDGDVQKMSVGKAVKNFNQIDVGDHVSVTFYESFIAEVLPESTEVSTPKDKSVALTPQGGEKGIATMGTQEEIVTVEAVDLQNREVTFKGPEGHLSTLPVKDDVRNLENLKVGDKVFMKFTQALAVSIKEE
jgi:preprotein translocase subunit YajC